MKHKYLCFYLSAMTLQAMAATPDAPAAYPAAPADDTIDTYFGTTVADPFRPLENDTAAATTAWVGAENELTRSYLDAIPFRSALHARLTGSTTTTSAGCLHGKTMANTISPKTTGCAIRP